MSRQLLGAVEFHTESLVSGWAVAIDGGHQPAPVDVLDNGTRIARITPDIFRWDLLERGFGNGTFGFRFPLDTRLYDGARHQIEFHFAEDGSPLAGSPITIESLLESATVPFTLSDLTGNTVLVLAPHPDDETFSCGGSIIHHRAAGDPVRIVFLTDGGRAPHDPERNGSLVATRQAEARAAAAILGVSDLEFWNAGDRALMADAPGIERLAQLLRDYRPTLVYTPSPLDFHPDHRATADLIWRAIQIAGVDCRVAFSDLNRPSNINTLVDISNVIGQKERAGRVYESQERNHPYVEITTAYNRFRALTVSASAQHVEAFVLLDSETIRQWPIEWFARTQVFPMAAQVDPPLVSVIVRTRNRPRLLAEAISSLLTQTYPSIEAIVVNDGGEDITAVLDPFRGYLPIREVVLTPSGGRSAAANAGLQVATGSYLAFLDDDDLLYPGHIDKLARFLHGSGEQFAYSDCERGVYRWNGDAHLLSEPKTPFQGLPFDRDRLFLVNYIPIHTAMFSRALLDAVGPLDEDLQYFEDWDLWIRMSQHAVLQHLPGITAEYRVMSDHRFDEEEHSWRIHRKHAPAWADAATMRRVLQRLEANRIEILGLRERSAELERELASSRDSLTGRMRRLIRRLRQEFGRRP